MKGAVDDVTDYLAELAFRLRWRHIGEARVREELVRIIDESRDGELPPEDRFGKPADYARTVARGKSLSPVSWWRAVSWRSRSWSSRFESRTA